MFFGTRGDGNASTIEQIHGLLNDGGNYSSVSNLKNSDVFTAVKVLSQDIADNPIVQYNDGVDEISKELNYLLNVKPNDFMSARALKFALSANLLLTGNAYARIERVKGEIYAIYLARPSWTTIEQDPNSGRLTYDINDDDGHHFKLDQDDVLHFKDFSTNGIFGKSPLYSLKREIEVQQSGLNMLTSFFKSGVNGSGILKVNKSDLDTNAKQIIRKEFVKANIDNNSSRVVVMDNTMEYENIEVDTSILKLVNTNNFSTQQIAKAFGLPAYKLGLEGVHTSVSQSDMDYIKNTLDHYFNVFNSELDVKLESYPTNLTKKFNFNIDRLLRLDPETKIKLAIQKRNAGGITKNEYRRELNYQPVDDETGDEFVVMSNFIPDDDLKGGENVGKQKLSNKIRN